MDYVTLLQKYAKEKENTPYLILKDRQFTYGQAYKDVRGFVAPEWKQQFPKDYKTSVLILSEDVYYQLLAFLAVMNAGQIPIIGHYDLPQDAENKLVEKNRIGFVLEEKAGRWTLKQGVSEPGETEQRVAEKQNTQEILSLYSSLSSRSLPRRSA